MDIDTTVKGQDLNIENAQHIVSEIAAIRLDDGVSFIIKDVETIMDEMEYPGIRFHLDAVFEKMITPIKIDVSTGDVITQNLINTEKLRISTENDRIYGPLCILSA